MTDNPLIRPDRNPGRGNPAMLHEHVAKLNNYRWIADPGKLYFVNQRTMANGLIEHFVDRHV